MGGSGLKGVTEVQMVSEGIPFVGGEYCGKNVFVTWIGLLCNVSRVENEVEVL